MSLFSLTFLQTLDAVIGSRTGRHVDLPVNQPRRLTQVPSRPAANDPPPDVRALIWSDIQLWAEGYNRTRRGGLVGFLSAMYLAMSFGGLRAALLYRLAYEAHRRGIRFIPLLLTNLNLTLHGFDMPPHVPVGPRFYIPHPYGIVVTARRLGGNVTLVSSVTIGMRKGHRFPLIGNDVYIGAGARVLGDITIGDRVQIGANAVVVHDVPSDSVAVGVPATIRPARH